MEDALKAARPDYDRAVDLAQRHYHSRVAGQAIILLGRSSFVLSDDPEWYSDLLTKSNPPTDAETIAVEGDLNISPVNRLKDLIYELGCRLAAPGFGVFVENEGAVMTDFFMQLNFNDQRQKEFEDVVNQKCKLISDQLNALHLLPSGLRLI